MPADPRVDITVEALFPAESYVNGSDRRLYSCQRCGHAIEPAYFDIHVAFHQRVDGTALQALPPHGPR